MEENHGLESFTFSDGRLSFSNDTCLWKLISLNRPIPCGFRCELGHTSTILSIEEPRTRTKNKLRDGRYMLVQSRLLWSPIGLSCAGLEIYVYKVRIMRKRLVRKTFGMIQELADNENNEVKKDYRKFWENFGKFVKLGCIEDTGNHKRITPLLRFFSSTSEDELISLDEYIDHMYEKQNVIYYIAIDSLKSSKSAPFL